MTARYAQIHDTTVRDAFERYCAQRVNTAGEHLALRPRRAHRRCRVGQAQPRPDPRQPPQRLLRPATPTGLPAPQRLPHLPRLPDHTRVPRHPPPPGRHQPAPHRPRRRQRPVPPRRQPPPRPGQPRPDHPRPRSTPRRRTRDDPRRQQPPPRRAAAARHDAAVNRAHAAIADTRPRRPARSPSPPSPAPPRLPRLALPPTRPPRHDHPAPHATANRAPTVPAAQRATADSLRQRLDAARDEIARLRAENAASATSSPAPSANNEPTAEPLRRGHVHNTSHLLKRRISRTTRDNGPYRAMPISLGPSAPPSTPTGRLYG